MPDRRRWRGTAAVRAASALVAVALAATVTVVLPAGDASAAAYRYWSYWWGGDGGWAYASAGAGTHRPADGSVEGWRFSVSGDGASSSRPPRAGPDFAALCAGTPAAAGKKRVGVVIDHGTGDDSPDGETPPSARGACAVVPDAATGAAVLAAVAAYRVEDGLVCGIDGYPARECAVVVGSPPAPSASRASTPAASRTTTRPTTVVTTPAPAAGPSSPVATATAPAAPDVRRRDRCGHADAFDPAAVDDADAADDDRPGGGDLCHDAAGRGRATGGARLLRAVTSRPRRHPDRAARRRAGGRCGRGGGHLAGPRGADHPPTPTTPPVSVDVRRRGLGDVRAVNRVGTGAVARWLHPGAWWLWALGLAAAATRTTNPLLLGLIVAVAAYVVAARRPTRPGRGRSRSSCGSAWSSSRPRRVPGAVRRAAGRHVS